MGGTHRLFYEEQSICLRPESVHSTGVGGCPCSRPATGGKTVLAHALVRKTMSGLVGTTQTTAVDLRARREALPLHPVGLMTTAIVRWRRTHMTNHGSWRIGTLNTRTAIAARIPTASICRARRRKQKQCTAQSQQIALHSIPPPFDSPHGAAVRDATVTRMTCQ